VYFATCILLLVLAWLALQGCRGHGRRVIGVVPKATSHLFWVSVQAGAFAAGREFNVEVLWNGPALETDYARQIQIVDSFVARRVDGLVVAPTERKALIGSIDRAMSHNIPVTIFDSGLDSTNYMTFVATDNYEAGRAAARTLAGLLGGRGKVAVVMNAPGSASTMERERGFDDVMAKEYPQIRIAARQFGMSDRSKAVSAAENILTAHPDLDGLFASAEPGTLGAALALKSRRLSGKVKCVGFDSSESIVEDLKQGTLDALVVQDPFRMGYEAVKTVVDRLNGGTPPKQIDLSARVVTRAEVDKPEVRAFLFPDVEKYLTQ
jgi:ribose transport system substrate-binding protein